MSNTNTEHVRRLKELAAAMQTGTPIAWGPPYQDAVQAAIAALTAGGATPPDASMPPVPVPIT